MPHRALAFFAAFFLVLLDAMLAPGQAHAWGPGVHMVTGNWILQNLGVFPAAVAAALMRHPGQFLHGSLSADIFVGKGSKAKKGHSHNWESGFYLLERAKRPRERAYAYGYLAHLAADTVAHNVFVPAFFHKAPGSGRLAHIFLESQADRLLDWDKQDALQVFHSPAGKATDAMLRRSMNRNFLLFLMQSGLYRGSIALAGSFVWRRSLRLVDAAARAQERSLALDQLLTVSARAAMSVLQLGQDSPVLTLDPIGADALAAANKSLCPYEDRPGKADACLVLPDALLHIPSFCTSFSPPHV